MTDHTFTAAQPVAWQKRPMFGPLRIWTPVSEIAEDHAFWREQEYEIRPLYTAQPPAVPVETEETSFDRADTVPVAWIAFAGNGNIRFWTADEGRAKDERARGLDLRAFTLAELVALVSKLPHSPSSADSDPLNGLDERLDRLLLTADDGGRFILSKESAKNIVGIVREWIRTSTEPQTSALRPIGDEPKDGTPFLGYLGPLKVPYFVCWWGTSIKTGEPYICILGIGELWDHKLFPTHWMPLPAPPVASEQGKST